MKSTDDELNDLGRFSEPALLIMISLADGPKHGYAMTEDIAQISGQRLGPGTLYGGITRRKLYWMLVETAALSGAILLILGAASAMACAWASDVARGFSHKICLPAASTGIVVA